MSIGIASPSLIRPRTILRFVLLSVVGAALITLGAKVQIPFWPVPMTLHVLAVLGLAVAFGPALGVGMVLAYLAAGAMGWPVFSGTPARGIGLAYMIGPTGGYLLGMSFAAWIAGRFSRPGEAGWQAGAATLLAMLAALATIYLPGLLWLARFIPAEKVIAAGFLPFIAGDLVKVGIIAVGAALSRRLLLSRREGAKA